MVGVNEIFETEPDPLLAIISDRMSEDTAQQINDMIDEYLQRNKDDE